MNTLTELNSTKHKNLKVIPESALEFAAHLHMVNLRVTELPRAVASLPVFFTRQTDSRDWAISAITSFEPNQNLFVKDGKWDALYQPTSIRTFPLHLMNSNQGEQQYSIGILEHSEAFSTEQGEPLFDQAGRPTLMLNEMQKLLESTIKEDIQSYQFAQKLDSLGLLKSIDISVQFADKSVQRVTGLSAINEDKLLSLSGEELQELNKLGYMTPIHAMLISIYQINDIVRRNNAIEGNIKIDGIKLEMAKDRTQDQL